MTGSKACSKLPSTYLYLYMEISSNIISTYFYWKNSRLPTLTNLYSNLFRNKGAKIDFVTTSLRSCRETVYEMKFKRTLLIHFRCANHHWSSTHILSWTISSLQSRFKEKPLDVMIIDYILIYNLHLYTVRNKELFKNYKFADQPCAISYFLLKYIKTIPIKWPLA